MQSSTWTDFCSVSFTGQFSLPYGNSWLLIGYGTIALQLAVTTAKHISGRAPWDDRGHQRSTSASWRRAREHNTRVFKPVKTFGKLELDLHPKPYSTKQGSLGKRGGPTNKRGHKGIFLEPRGSDARCTRWRGCATLLSYVSKPPLFGT